MSLKMTRFSKEYYCFDFFAKSSVAGVAMSSVSEKIYGKLRSLVYLFTSSFMLLVG
jgi:hypothetical protein